MRVEIPVFFALLGALGLVSPGRTADELPFRAVAAEWGVDFRHHHGGSGRRYMVESVAGGLAVLDADDDGDLDLFFVDGGALPGYDGEAPGARLFRNEGPGRYRDVTGSSGVAVSRYGMGAVAGDVDGDGDLDLYVTQLGRNQLFENLGDGTFRDVTARASVGDPRFSASAAFADADADGDLDLYVVNYVGFTVEAHEDCSKEGIPGYCGPEAYPPQRDTFYRNRGDGTFEDATAEVGLEGAVGPGLGVAFSDLDGDGTPDLYVANDAQPNFLFRNRGDGTFEDVSLLSGTAFGPRGNPEGGMGVAVGDLDGDGREDLVVTNFEFEGNAIYRNRGSMLFHDDRFRARVVEASLPALAFGVELGDFDLDGDLDLAVGNGHIQDNAHLHFPTSRWAQEDHLFWNDGTGVFALSPGALGPPRVTRALGAGYLDLDGDLDLVAVHTNDRAEVYENLASGSWLQVDVRYATTGSPVVGARVVADGRVRRVRTGTSYLTGGPPTVSFGLGDADRSESLLVEAPGGPTLRLRSIPAGRRVRVVVSAP